MNMMFRPAVCVANKLKFSQKFSLIFVLFLIPLLASLSIILSDANEAIDGAEGAEAGEQLVAALKPIAIVMAKHRGNTSQHLNGATGKAAVIEGLEAKARELFGDYSALLAQTTAFPVQGLSMDDIESRWRSLALSRATDKAAENFSQHSEVIAAVLQRIGLVVNRSGLALSEDLSSYYLTDIMAFSGPRLQEMLGQLRGKAAGALADGLVSDSEKVVVTALLASAQQAADDVNTNLDYLFDSWAQLGEISDLEAGVANFQRAIDKFTSTLRNEVINVEVPSVSSDAVFALGTQAIGSFGVINNSSVQLMGEAVAARVGTYLSKRNTILVVALLALAVAVYLGLGIVLSIRQSVKQLQSSASELAQGNFAIRFEVDSRDSLAEVVESLNQMIVSVAGLISSMQLASGDVSSTAAQLQQASGISREEVEKQRSQTELLATAATEMAATVREVALNCNHSVEATQAAYEAIQKGVPIVNKAVNSISELSEDVASSSAVISQLEKEVGGISSVVDVIRGIAEQTNLLALNAAIEAARAGEQGRGFAVVADEVRTLASRTQESTSEIQSMIESLQAGSARAVDTTESGRAKAIEAVGEISSAGEAFKQIDVEIGRLVDLNSQISTASEEQSAVAEDIARNTNLVNSAAEVILDQMQETAQSGDNLLARAEHLNQASSQFTVS